MTEAPCIMCQEKEKVWRRSFHLDVQMAVAREDCRALKALSASPDFKASLNSVDIDGWTILHKAVGQQLEKAVDFLLQQGASTERENHAGQTAVHVACSTGNAKITQSLVRAGGLLVSPLDKFGCRPFDYGPVAQPCKYPLMQAAKDNEGCSLQPGPDTMTLSVPMLDSRSRQTYQILRKDRRGRYRSRDSMADIDRTQKQIEKENAGIGFRWPAKEHAQRPLQLRSSNRVAQRPVVVRTSAECGNQGVGEAEPGQNAASTSRFHLRPVRGFQQMIRSMRTKRGASSPSPSLGSEQEGEACNEKAQGSDENQPEPSENHEELHQFSAIVLAPIHECPEPEPPVPNSVSTHECMTADEAASLEIRGISHSKAYTNLPDLLDEGNLNGSEKDSVDLSECSGLLMTLSDNSDITGAPELGGNLSDHVQELDTNVSNVAQPGSSMRNESECSSELIDWSRESLETPKGGTAEECDDAKESRKINVERMFGQPTPQRYTAQKAGSTLEETAPKVLPNKETTLDNEDGPDDSLQEILRDAGLY